MMRRDGLVKFLRDYGNHDSHDGPELYGEAADEIERLENTIRFTNKAMDALAKAAEAKLKAANAAERERCIRMVFAYVDDVKDAQATAAAIREGE